MVEKDGPDVIQMSVESEEASSCLIRPDLDFVVVTTGNEERLCLMEVNATHWSIVFFESVYECPHSVVP